MDINNARRRRSPIGAEEASYKWFVERQLVARMKDRALARLDIDPDAGAYQPEEDRQQYDAEMSRVGCFQPADEAERPHDKEQAEKAEDEEN
jgi:hypothetical protein